MPLFLLQGESRFLSPRVPHVSCCSSSSACLHDAAAFLKFISSQSFRLNFTKFCHAPLKEVLSLLLNEGFTFIVTLLKSEDDCE